ncbi:MAG: 16S rRNA (uracil(1498)-N(3))-methyltransferase [Candidatus Solibacter usitatus]|nr:16S rRNA (uracil(1498)-N(3))-methyltransferase [Candidatus Solibacter usitatus]
MARRRFFVDRVHDGRAELAGDEARHLSRVLRATPGQRYEVSDGHALYLAEIAEVSAQRVLFRIVEPLDFTAPPVEITLLAALIKFDRFEWIVEKATELGVAKIVPMDCERSEKGLAKAAEKRRERWQRVAREASQQSRRVHLPEIAEPATLKQATTQPAKYRFALEENPGAPPLLTAAMSIERRHGDTVALAVGPEGGWTEDERALLPAAGFTAVSAGFQIMRAETAAIAAMAVLTNAWLAPIRIEG